MRQEIAKSLLREYRYSQSYVEVEFVVRVGTQNLKPIYLPANALHVGEDADINCSM
ncbi:MAG: hypothetical protein H0U60_16155 [Blastocatellia bacterium]|nr:hypothetical protein [Blastocatellia bacterium]